jgi:hypothetical protein
MPTDKDLGWVFSRAGPERLHAEVLEDEQVDARELLDEIPACAAGVSTNRALANPTILVFGESSE